VGRGKENSFTAKAQEVHRLIVDQIICAENALITTEDEL
jgi:hypothetical protein